MPSLMQEISDKAASLCVPLSVQLDLTYRCNQRCVHCYVERDDHGEMTTAEFKDILGQLAEAGALFLSLSGGEVLLREDFFEILEHARALLFNVRLKTNGTLLRERDAKRLHDLGVEQVQVSIYSHRPEAHDGITRIPGSLERSVQGIRLLKSQGLKVAVSDVLMRQNMHDYAGVQALAADLGAVFTMDPTVTPKMNGDRSVTALRVPLIVLKQLFSDPSLVGSVKEFCAPPPPPDDEALDGRLCSAAHSACYISPYGDLFPCVQFPLLCGSVRRQKFLDVWRGSPVLEEVRAIRPRDLPACCGCAHLAGCTRCPGLAYMEGDLRGPSPLDCEKSYARTGIPTPF
jgi:radical SAM protein with 4Fe4S-binding SPASM domain